MLTIRQGMSVDAPAICSIWNRVIRDTDFTFTTDAKTVEQVFDAIETDPARWLVADDGGCIGFVTFGPFRSGPGYAHTCEHSIYVADSATGRQVGTALIAAYETWAVHHGMHVLIAWISATNSRAIGFHAGHCFTEVARMPEVGLKGGDWQDLVLMQKILS